jgi:hypothetical protein
MGRVALVLLLAVGCSHDWDGYAPLPGTTSEGVGGGPASTGVGAGSTTGAATGGDGGNASGASSAGGSAGNAGSGRGGSAGGGGSSGQGGSGGQAGSGGQGGGVVSSCPAGGVRDLVDDFDDGTIGAIWDAQFNGAVQATETGGELVLTMTPDPSTDIFGQLLSTSSYSFASCSAVVRAMADVPTPRYAGMLVVTGGPELDRLEISVAGGNMEFAYWIDGMPNYIGEIPYVPGKHVWWRIREDSGTTFWETSEDGTTFTVQEQAANPLPVASVKVALYAGAEPGMGAAGEVHFDDLNLPP